MKINSKILYSLWFLLLIALLLIVGCQRSRAGITVAGSTSVEPFAELLAEEYMIRYPQSHIYVQGGGSTAGIEAVRTHAAQIGMSSRSLTSEEKDLFAVTIAKVSRSQFASFLGNLVVVFPGTYLLAWLYHLEAAGTPALPSPSARPML